MAASPRRFDVLITAQEAFPAFERLWLEATDTVNAGFRIFDPWTKLHSPDARAIGTTWFDLIVATLNRGVQITLKVSDFDPVVRTGDHRYAWRCVRGLIAASEASDNPHLLRVTAAMHPARVGILPRLAIWPRVRSEIKSYLQSVDLTTADDRRAFLESAPGIAPYLRDTDVGLVPQLFPPAPLVPVSQHQKICVFDDRILYVGGLDLNDRRYDTPTHQRAGEDTWHDVQVIVDGPVAAEAGRHLETFVQMTNRELPAGKPAHLLRTLSRRRFFAAPFLSPAPLVDELAEAHLANIAAAEHLIYLETQFFRDQNLADALATRALQNPNLSLILILPAAPEDVAFNNPGSDAAFGEHLQVKCVDKVRDAFGARAFIGAPAQPRATAEEGRSTHYGAPLVYLHAKVSVFDDRAAIVSSANLNGRSMAWDTEAGITTITTEEVRALQRRCFEHWLGSDVGPAFFDHRTARETWAQRALKNASVAPEDRQGFLLPYDPDAARDTAQNLPGVPNEMV